MQIAEGFANIRGTAQYPFSDQHDGQFTMQSAYFIVIYVLFVILELICRWSQYETLTVDAQTAEMLLMHIIVVAKLSICEYNCVHYTRLSFKIVSTKIVI